MLRTALLLFLGLCLSAPLTGARAAGTESIAAVVNEDAITFSDVNDRIKLVMVSSGLPDSEEIRARILPQVLDSLIEEQLMFQEAKRLELNVDPKEVEEGFGTIAKQNNVPAENFKAMLRGAGINTTTMSRQIESQLLWTKIVQREIRPTISVNDADVDSFIERRRANIGKNEYLAAEIFLPVENPAEEGSMRDLAARLYKEVSEGKAPFFKLAQQFSKAPGAARGGDMGWVQEGQIAPEIAQALVALAPNSLSLPVKSPSGYHLFLLREKRAITQETLPTREQARGAIGTERLDRAQRRRLMDLKTAGFIEKRV